MDRIGAMLVRGLALVAALVAVCAFHSSASEAAESRPVASVTQLDEVPAADSMAEQESHLLVVVLLSASALLLLAARVLRPAAYAPRHLRPPVYRAVDPPAPSLTRLCVLRT